MMTLLDSHLSKLTKFNLTEILMVLLKQATQKKPVWFER